MTDILDIHTHKQDVVSRRNAIINCRTLTDTLCTDGFYSAGIHPWELTEQNATQQLELLRQQIVNKQIVAIGEAGLDKLTQAPIEFQIAVFRQQIELSEEHELPLIIHCVKAMDELLALKKEYHPLQPWIWHGFRGKPEQAQQLVKKGFYLSFGEHYPDGTMAVVPDERLFLETDDSPVDIEDILNRAARVRRADKETLRETIRKNIRNVFFRA